MYGLAAIVCVAACVCGRPRVEASDGGVGEVRGKMEGMGRGCLSPSPSVIAPPPSSFRRRCRPEHCDAIDLFFCVRVIRLARTGTVRTDDLFRIQSDALSLILSLVMK